MLEPENIRKVCPVSFVRWIGNEDIFFALIFEDCSMHLVNDLFENHKHSNPETAYKIYEQMRLIEKTRIVSQNNQTIHYQQMELPSQTDQLSFTSFIS